MVDALVPKFETVVRLRGDGMGQSTDTQSVQSGGALSWSGRTENSRSRRDLV